MNKQNEELKKRVSVTQRVLKKHKAPYIFLFKNQYYIWLLYQRPITIVISNNKLLIPFIRSTCPTHLSLSHRTTPDTLNIPSDLTALHFSSLNGTPSPIHLPIILSVTAVLSKSITSNTLAVNNLFIIVVQCLQNKSLTIFLFFAFYEYFIIYVIFS